MKAFTDDLPHQGLSQLFDVVVMFKVLLLQKFYNLSDSQIEYLIHDRLSFRKFLGLGVGDETPGREIIDLFREKLTRTGVMDVLFERLDEYVRDHGIIINYGSIVEISLMENGKTGKIMKMIRKKMANQKEA
jgi:IS5 family transposase